MIWAGINDNNIRSHSLFGSVKLTYKAYCELLESVLLLWFENICLCQAVVKSFMHDNTPSHSAKATTSILTSLCIKGDSLMVGQSFL